MSVLRFVSPNYSDIAPLVNGVVYRTNFTNQREKKILGGSRIPNDIRHHSHHQRELPENSSGECENFFVVTLCSFSEGADFCSLPPEVWVIDWPVKCRMCEVFIIHSSLLSVTPFRVLTRGGHDCFVKSKKRKSYNRQSLRKRTKDLSESMYKVCTVMSIQ